MSSQVDSPSAVAKTSLPWTVEKLRGMDPWELDELARGAGRSLVMGRLVLGRILVELDRRTHWDEWGFSGSIHYAVRALHLSRRDAREMRRVARELQALPVLNAAAERGDLGWSHLREVVRVAVPETEEAWLEAAGIYAWKVFHRLVRQAIRGDLPGEASQPAEAEQVEVCILLAPEQAEVFNAGLARLSRRFGRLVDPAEAVEYAFAELLAGNDATLDARLQQARDLLDDLQDLRDRQADQQDACARAAAFRASRRARCSAPAEEQRPTWVVEAPPSAEEERPTRVVEDPAPAEEERPTWVVEDAPDPSRPVFRYPVSGSGDGMLRDGPAWEDTGSAPRIGWEMVSASQVPCPDNPDLWLLSADRQPFWAWATASKSLSQPASAPASASQGRRQQAIRRGARSRRGSAETRRTVQRRDGFACMCPDCPHTVWLHAHHLTLYCQGGLSVPSGMVLLCTRCHRNVHRGTLRIHGNPDSGLDWRDSRGLPLGQATASASQGAVAHAVHLVAAAVAA